MRFWLKQFFSDGKAHWKAVEEVFFVCGISLIPLFMLAIIDQLRQASPSASELFWGAIASGQLYLYSFSLFGTLFWLCQKEHENFPRFEPRRYLTLLVFVPSVLIVIIYSIEPSMSKPLSHGFVGASFAVYLLYVVLYYVLLVFDHLEPPPVEKGLQEGAGTLIDKYKHLGESLSQATVVKGLLPYISKDPLLDRDAGKRFGFWEPALASANAKRIFYEFFRRDEDERILQIVMNYFLAVSARWPDAWKNTGKGNIINRTNGFNGFIRFLRPAYLYFTTTSEVVSEEQFARLFAKVKLEDGDFSPEKFLPGSSGATKLYKTLLEQTGVEQ